MTKRKKKGDPVRPSPDPQLVEEIQNGNWIEVRRWYTPDDIREIAEIADTAGLDGLRLDVSGCDAYEFCSTRRMETPEEARDRFAAELALYEEWVAAAKERDVVRRKALLSEAKSLGLRLVEDDG